MMFVQPQHQEQEELAALFSRNLSLQPVEPAKTPEEPVIVYISQHYSHPVHFDQPKQSPSQPADLPPRPASEPSYPERSVVETVLRNHGVDPTCLSGPQLELFKTAEEPQQLRLVELWRICPPTAPAQGRDDVATLAWSSTSMEQEEILARTRYEQQQQQRQQVLQQQPPLLSLDGTPLTPNQEDDGRWISMALQNDTEPYMVSGYEQMARREYEESARQAYMKELKQSKNIHQPVGSAMGLVSGYKPAMDPVYQLANPTVDWRWQQQQQQQKVAMENAYGRIMQFRGEDEEML